MGNPIQHIEWRTKDAARLKTFYGAVFDWEFPEWMPGYMGVITSKNGSGGGIYQIPEGDPSPPGIVCYATVDEIAATEERIRLAGGTILLSNMEVPRIGWFTIFADPDGNSFAIWKQDPAAIAPPREQAAAVEAPVEKRAKKAAKKAKKAAKKATRKAAKAVKKAAKRGAKAAKAKPKAKKKKA